MDIFIINVGLLIFVALILKFYDPILVIQDSGFDDPLIDEYRLRDNFTIGIVGCYLVASLIPHIQDFLFAFTSVYTIAVILFSSPHSSDNPSVFDRLLDWFTPGKIFNYKIFKDKK